MCTTDAGTSSWMRDALLGALLLAWPREARERQPARALAERLIDALAAGAAVGGDKRRGAQQATSAYVTVYNRTDGDGAPYVHVAVMGIEKGKQPAVATLVTAFERWRRESSHQRSTRLRFIP